MASDFRQVNDRLIQGEGDPSEGDALVMNISIFPKGTVYVNNNSGEVFARNADDQVVGDWVSQAGGGSGGIDDVLAAGQALTEERNINTNTHDFKINENQFVLSGGTTYLSGLVLTKADGGYIGIRSPNGSSWNISISDEGILTVTAD